MNARLWRRLERVESRSSTPNRLVMFRPNPAETKEDLERRVERWRSGEDMDGVKGRIRGGTNLIIVRRPL